MSQARKSTIPVIYPPVARVYAAKLPWLVLLLGLFLSVVQYQWSIEKQRRAQQTMFEKRVDQVVQGLKRRLEGNFQVLRGVRGLFTADDHVTRNEFRAYYQALTIDRLYPGIQGIGFSRWLAASEIAEFEQVVRSEGFKDFAIKPPGPRPEYSAIKYLEPFDWRNQRAFGYDMYSEPIRRKAMREAVDSNQPALSGRVTLVQETEADVQAGFLVYVPLYKRDLPTSTAQERWRALLGWAYSPLRAKNLLDSFLGSEFPGIDEQIEFKVFDGANADEGQLLYQNGSGSSPDPSLQAVSKTLELYGHPWLVVATPNSGRWSEQQRNSQDQYILISGIVFSFAIALMLFVLEQRNQRVSRALTETTAANLALEANKTSLRLAGVVMQASPTGIFVANAKRQLVAVNPSFSVITGFAQEAVIGQEVSILFGGQSGDAQNVWRDLQQFGVWHGELSFRRPDGNPYPSELSIKQVADSKDQIEHFVGMFTDISDRRKDEQRMRFLAHHDYLTGLANRALLLDRAEQAILAAFRYELKPVLLFIDLDRFKPINDTYGHETGDAVLKEVARRVEETVRESDLVCRLGGDEFVILLTDHQDDPALNSLAKDVLQAIEKPYRVGSRSLQLSASIGIARFGQDGQTVQDLMANADAAMYRAKQGEGQNIAMSNPQAS